MSYINDEKGNLLTREQLVSKMIGTAQPGSEVHEQLKMAVIARSVGDIENAVSKLKESIDKSSYSNGKLSQKLFWLNIILTSATVVYAIVAVIQLIK